MAEELTTQIVQLLDQPELPFAEKIAAVEKAMMVDALERSNWVRSRAAKEMKITYRIFNYKFAGYRLEHHLAYRMRRRQAVNRLPESNSREE